MSDLKYIADLDEIPQVENTDLAAVQKSTGGANTTYRVTIAALRALGSSRSVVVKTGDYTVTATDHGKVFAFDNGDSPDPSATITILPGINVGQFFEVVQTDTNGVTVAVDSSPSPVIESIVGSSSTSSAGDHLTFLKVTSTKWIGY